MNTYNLGANRRPKTMSTYNRGTPIRRSNPAALCGILAQEDLKHLVAAMVD